VWLHSSFYVLHQLHCYPISPRFFLPSFRRIIIIPPRAICSAETWRNQSESKDVISRLLLDSCLELSSRVLISGRSFQRSLPSRFSYFSYPYNFIYDRTELCLRHLSTCQRALPVPLCRVNYCNQLEKLVARKDQFSFLF